MKRNQKKKCAKKNCYDVSSCPFDHPAPPVFKDAPAPKLSACSAGLSLEETLRIKAESLAAAKKRKAQAAALHSLLTPLPLTELDEEESKKQLKMHAEKTFPNSVATTCSDCASLFILDAGQGQWFIKKQLFIPTRCTMCRLANRSLKDSIGSTRR
jgi:hypothetical protein